MSRLGLEWFRIDYGHQLKRRGIDHHICKRLALKRVWHARDLREGALGCNLGGDYARGFLERSLREDAAESG